jgi:hypothetical protein
MHGYVRGKGGGSRAWQGLLGRRPDWESAHPGQRVSAKDPLRHGHFRLGAARHDVWFVVGRRANPGPEVRAAEDRSADPLGQRHDDPLRTAHVGHAPDVLVLADVADQPVAVRGQPVDGRLEVVDLEGHVAQP